MLRLLVIILITIIVSFSANGCGETVSGVGKDIHRVGKGIRTIFVRDE